MILRIHNIMFIIFKRSGMSIHELFDTLFNYKQVFPTLQDSNSVESLKTYLIPLITTTFYPKRQLLLSAGQVAGYIHFLEQGLARGFYISEGTGKEITDFLWNEHSLITVPDSFFSQRPSHLFIEVMPDSRLMSISYQGLMSCIEKYPLAEVFSRNLVLQYNIYKTRRNHDLAFLSPWELYVRLLHKHPNIEQQVSKGIIASYLNITPQSLSRMLKRRGHP